MVTIEQIKQLRDETSISIGECKKALEASGGDLAKAKDLLKQWGKELASKKSERETCQGIVDAYLHANGKIGVMIELRCETDFVAKSADFKALAHELCLQFAAMGDDPDTLLAQPWIKDSSKTVKDLVEQAVSKLGENIVIKKVVRFQM